VPDELAAKAETLRRLHHGTRPLVLPNAWDVASARLVEGAGFPVVATSSAAIARTLGYEDDDSMPVDDAFAAVRRIAAAVAVPVTADLEAGYRLSPDELADRLVDAGAVGCNLEDTEHHGGGGLVAAEEQAIRLAEVKRAGRERGVDLVLNARVDVFRGTDSADPELVAEGVRRARFYGDAGADCVYPIRLADETGIAEFVRAASTPVNVLFRPGTPPISRLAELGVARVSLASGLFRTAYAAARDALAEMDATATP
jgi:2-methylisocitrate lyase-like PEP mutase family enzyme